MHHKSDRLFRRIARRIQRQQAIATTNENIKSVFTIPGMFFEMDIGGYGLLKNPPITTQDARYIFIARRRIRRMINAKPTVEELKEQVNNLIGGTIMTLKMPEGEFAYVLTPAGIMWLDQPPTHILNPDSRQRTYTAMLQAHQPYYEYHRANFLRGPF